MLKKGPRCAALFFSVPSYQKIILAFSPVLLVTLAYSVLQSGSNGSFLFDDYVNLPALGDYGGVHSWHTLALYLTSGLGDPAGRPLSLLSFLIDATDWPASPQPFLRTNILLHLLNGLLLVLVLLHLARTRRLDELHAQKAAIFGAGIWLLHPLFLSTTLYIVQREAMLPALFTLLGILAWLAGRRSLIERSAKGRGYLLLFIGSIVCTTLAVLCKANGALLPLLLLVTEATVLAGTQSSLDFVRARRIFLGPPVFALTIFLLCSLPHWIAAAPGARSWTLGQRLLTEPRVLIDYLQALGIPRAIGNGIFHDNFQVSTDWLHPISTPVAIMLVTFCIAAACKWRRFLPIISFAILFFFSAHLLESSVVPLELYFEHRNYLPAMMAFWPLALWLTGPGRLAIARAIASMLLLAGLSMDTHIGAQKWSHPAELAMEWANRQPDSPRAQAYAAQHEMSAGRYKAAQSRLLNALADRPDEPQLAFNLADAQCNLGGVTASTVEAMKYAVANNPSAARLDFSWLSDAAEHPNACLGLDSQIIGDVVHALRGNIHFVGAAGREQDFDHIEGLLALHRGEPEQALREFDLALAILPKPQIALTQAALLAGAGRPDLGLRHLDEYSRRQPKPIEFGLSPLTFHAWLLDRAGYWPDALAQLRHVLADETTKLQDARNSATSPRVPNS